MMTTSTSTTASPTTWQMTENRFLVYRGRGNSATLGCAPRAPTTPPAEFCER